MNNSELSKQLQAYFPPEEIKWKPQAVKGNRAMAIAYINARVVMDRLDDVVGPANWQDSYEIMPDGNVKCVLSIKVGDEWVSKADVGGESEQPDGGDRCKAAVSDALKRAAVKWGIGRYLYGFPQQWCDFDPNKKSFVSTPTLPKWAIPSKTTSAQTTTQTPTKPQPIADKKSNGVGEHWATLEMVEDITNYLQKLNSSWSNPQVKARVSTYIGRQLSKEDQIKHLTEEEAEIVIDKLREAVKKLQAEEMAKQAQQPEREPGDDDLTDGL